MRLFASPSGVIRTLGMVGVAISDQNAWYIKVAKLFKWATKERGGQTHKKDPVRFKHSLFDGEEPDDRDEGVRDDADECGRVQHEVGRLADLRVPDLEVAETDDGDEDGAADDAHDRVEADQEHQTFLKGSSHLKFD